MKTIAKKNYMNPQINVMLIQNQQSLLAGSAYGATVDDRENGGEIGDN